ncbi:TetR family transcriptional regulator [Streptomyces sp. Go-475]|uniref:TetR/AcrR family transcriptional regulator n=1 Tax=Streptomyces sp. Go-475 TaxID=2072505 RepID=UPI000DEFF835|nr:TetR family transcriptional regulator [Streptomyces sp. Go-475]AXE90498.1 transcriptional regulator BetI [Streptomyces sp. Go-475]
MAQPGRRPAQQERSRITERKILAAARQALAEDGWEGLAVARVAAAAGVSVGSVYGRFTDKDGLVHAVQHDMLDEVDADLRDAFARLGERTDTPPAQLVADAVHALAEQVARHGVVMGRLILWAAADPSLRERGNATGALAEELFTSLVLDRADQLACPRPEAAVPMAFRAVNSTETDAVEAIRELTGGFGVGRAACAQRGVAHQRMPHAQAAGAAAAHARTT